MQSGNLVESEHYFITVGYPDSDGDGFLDNEDNCPLIANPDQVDTDDDGIGDVCDDCLDIDGDGYGSPGDVSCTNGTETDCDDYEAGIYPGATELCDGIDNDCDSSTDEDFTTLGDSCVNGLGECENSGVLVCSGDGLGVECDAVAFNSSEEICDNLDNNCDGNIDDNVTRETFCGVGACSDNTGIETCSAGSWGGDTCNPYIGAVSETCDGIDNDCDDSVDEIFLNLNDSCSVGVGECEGSGVFICNLAGTGTACDAVAFDPTEEICDNLDNDCDNSIDENLIQETSCGVGACLSNTGQESCTAGVWGDDTCDAFDGASTETCDGIDNDCDNSTDEIFLNLNDSCSVGVGECEGDGVFVCSGDELSTECNAVEGTPSDETCDNLDNDCDSDVDEDLTQETFCGVGACSDNTGEAVCEAGSWINNTCDAFNGASVETCDNIDNDCDSDVDEDLTRPSVCGVGACFGNTGEESCSLGTWGDDSCDAYFGATDETCDGIDNDCDSSIDEDMIAPFNSNQDGVCEDSLQVCNGVSGWDEDYSEVSWYEIPEVSCDGLDNDCDDSVDEGFANNDEDNQADCVDSDDDNDGVDDNEDNCQFVFNPNQYDSDNDDIGNDCDDDDDNDGVVDIIDNCQFTANPGQEDSDFDSVGDVCDEDFDNDGYLDGDDNCPFDYNPGQEDVDDDGEGDVCDEDADNDGVDDLDDNCPLIANPGQENNDLDSSGDECDEDDDNDDVDDSDDNCPLTYNPGQEDEDSDGYGDECDLCVDLDGDGYGSPGHFSCAKGDEEDCDDSDDSIHPNAHDPIDDIDQNCVNDAPVIEEIDDINVNVGGTVRVDPDIEDPEGDAFTYTISSPVGDDGFWKTDEEDKGSHRVIVTATDGSASSATDFTINIGKTQSEDVALSRIRFNDMYVKAGEGLEISVDVENDGLTKLKNVRVTAVIQELGLISRSNNVDLNKNNDDVVKVSLDIPSWVEPGEYDVRITVSNDKIRRVKHRVVVVY